MNAPIQAPSPPPPPAPAPSANNNTQAPPPTPAPTPPPLQLAFTPTEPANLAVLEMGGRVEIPLPRDCDPGDLMNIVDQLSSNTQQSQVNATRQDIQVVAKKTADLNTQARTQLDNFIKKSAAAHKHDHARKFLKFISKIGGYVSKAMGAAGMVGIVASPMGLVALGFSLYGMAKGKSFMSPSQALATGVISMMEAAGMSKADAEKHGELVAGAIGALSGEGGLDQETFGEMAKGAALESGAGESKAALADMVVTTAASVAAFVVTLRMPGMDPEQLTANLSKLASYGSKLQNATQVLDGSTTTADGALAIDSAQQQAAADRAKADGDETKAHISFLKVLQQQDVDVIQKIMEQAKQVEQATSDSIADKARGISQVVDNMEVRI